MHIMKNFAKHQNIKVKEKIKSVDNDEGVKNEEAKVKENFKNQINDNEGNKFENKIIQNEEENINKHEIVNLEITNKDINKIDDNMRDEKINDNSQRNIPIFLESKTNKKKKSYIILDNSNKETEYNILGWFSDADEEIPLGEGDRVICEWHF